MTRSEARPAWEKIVDIGFADYTQLTRDQRVWFDIEPLTTGGIIDHYVNYGAEHNEETIADLEFLGYPDVADMLRTVNSLFKNSRPPEDIDERNKQIGDFSDKDEELLGEINNKFWERSDELEQALLDHINATGIGKE